MHTVSHWHSGAPDACRVGHLHPHHAHVSTYSHRCAHACTLNHVHPTSIWIGAPQHRHTHICPCLTHGDTQTHMPLCVGLLSLLSLLCLARWMMRPAGSSPEHCWAALGSCSPHVLGCCLLTRRFRPSPWVEQHSGQGPEGQPPNRAEGAHPCVGWLRWTGALWVGEGRS